MKINITRQGQPYYDQEIVAAPKDQTIIRSSIEQAFRTPQKPDIVVGHERIWLRWMKPDSRGGLVPMDQKRRGEQ